MQNSNISASLSGGRERAEPEVELPFQETTVPG